MEHNGNTLDGGCRIILLGATLTHIGWTLVEKSYFVKVAPKYYAMAIASYFLKLNGSSTKTTIQSFYGEADSRGYVDIDESLLEKGLIFDEAADFLVRAGALKALKDPFAPTIYLQSETFYDVWNELLNEEPYSIFSTLGNGGDDWLRSALLKVNAKFDELDVKASDFQMEDPSWQPIDLDRTDEYLKDAVIKVDEAIKQITQDNGYAATFPEERAFVLDNLKQTSAKLAKDDTISAGYMRANALNPLLLIYEKYGKAAIGVASKVAGQAIMAFLKSKGVDVLDHAFRMFRHFL